MNRGVIVLAVVLGWRAFAAPPPGVELAPTPVWVTPVESGADAPDAGGMVTLLVDQHLRFIGGKRAFYHRVVARLTGESGVKVFGNLELGFTPPHERLVLHAFRVRRGDEVTSRLERADIRLLQREAELEASVLGGSQTALILVDDLRVGDVVELAYSVIGKNPVLGDHLGEVVDLSSTSPVARRQLRVLTDRQPQLRLLGGAPEAEVIEVGGLKTFVWRRDDDPGVTLEPQVPSDQFQIPAVQLSDYGTWRNVADWGAALFPAPRELPPSLRTLVDEIRREPAPERQVRAALRAVQNDVRYFSLAIGESSHRAAPPGVVYERRFGDCKDKALLLRTVLRELGFHAEVALVNTRGSVAPYLPMPLFDHAIVAVHVGGRVRFIDPTRMDEVGDFEALHPHGVTEALITGRKEVDLMRIGHASLSGPTLSNTRRYIITGWGEPVVLEHRSVYTGLHATFMRGWRRSVDAKAFAEARLEFIRGLHADALAEGEPEISDDLAQDRITIAGRYRLPSAWRGEAGASTFAFEHRLLASDLLPDVTDDRKRPLALSPPIWMRDAVTIDSLVDLGLVDEHKDVEGPGFHYTYRAKSADQRRIDIAYELRITGDRVEPAAFASYRRNLEAARQTVSFSIGNPAAVTTPTGLNLMLVVLIAIWSVLLLVAMRWIMARGPHFRSQAHFDPRLVGLGGWLALMGVMLGLGVLALARDLAEIRWMLDLQVWHVATTPGTDGYSPYLAPIILFEVLGNATQAWFMLFLLVLYFSKHRSFPLVFVLTQAGILLFLLGDYVLTKWALPDADVTFEPPRVFGSILWSLYVLLSVRVRSTFLPLQED